VVPPLLEKVVPEIEEVRRAEQRRIEALRRRSGQEAKSAKHDADEALIRAVQASREAMDWFRELQGWVVHDQDSARLITALQRTGPYFRIGLYANTPEERIEAIDNLIAYLQEAIALCKTYRGDEDSGCQNFGSR
jgi:hypothetical protein